MVVQKMSEKNFWNLIRNNLGIKMHRVENRVSSGMPDVHYVSNKGSGWIELKYVSEFPRKGKMKIGIRKAQKFWHRAYYNHGGKSWILIRVGRRGIILVNGNKSDEISQGITSEKLIDISEWYKIGNFNPEDWESLKGAINGKNKESS
jgi:hypothetical protein